MNHVELMRRCLELAQKGRGLVGNNPLVGAVLVEGNDILGNGYYKGSGTDHAEVAAVVDAAQCAASTGSRLTLYVNLEPCCHHGNTPPCTDFIIKSGIKTVIYGMQDPDPRVSGQGIARLREAGIEVIGPVCRAECERLNRGYRSLRTKNRPYITLKKAQTVEGWVCMDDLPAEARRAKVGGSKLCITSEKQNTWSHENLRKTHDGILVGVGTVISDNPELTTRHTTYDIRHIHQPTPIILDPDLRIPLDVNVVREGTIIVMNEAMLKSRNAEKHMLENKGCDVIAIPCVEDAFDLHSLLQSLSTINYQLSTILVEGGPTTWAAFKQADLIDEEVILVN